MGKRGGKERPMYISEKNIKLFGKHGIYTEVELKSRCEILMENYCKIINIEALTALDMAKKDITPAVAAYVRELAETANLIKSVDSDIITTPETDLMKKLANLLSCFIRKIDMLEKAVLGAKGIDGDIVNIAMYYKDNVLTAMQELRAVADEMEANMSAKLWPYPSYGTLLFSV